MEWQQILVGALVLMAAAHVARLLWREVRGLIHPEDGHLCPGCGECGGESDPLASGRRHPPEIRVSPLIAIDTGDDAEERRSEAR
jgi:hypothetical protein